MEFSTGVIGAVENFVDFIKCGGGRSRKWRGNWGRRGVFVG